MEELDKYDPKIGEYFNEVDFEKWATVHPASNRYSTMTSNIAESLNATNVAARELPITTMLEFLRSLVQKWSNANKICARSLKTDMTRVDEEILIENYIRSLHLTVTPAADNLYTITKTKTLFSVDLEQEKCCYRRFQTDKETYINTYDSAVYLMTNKSTWNTPQEVIDVIVLPPESRTKFGRPKKKRILAGHEKG
ncbi:uncharacterized protein LOC126672686 [Mercurialis annua]|uniref:uncharacterized protein LOC126672686 n=1 Tax=Mercurialis annua TaxID=3986 RepID=UPI00215EB56A|nr:uncharacterized protein LOC126672686 [Mercurialis annua]